MKTFITLIALLCLTSLLRSETIQVVKNGKTSDHTLLHGSSWQESKGFLSGSNPGQTVSTKLPIEGDNFSILTTLKLEKINHSAAGIYIGTEFFGFDGKNGYFLEGGSFGGATYIKKAPPLVAGKEFTFKATCANQKISFYINGEHITSQTYKHQTVARIALRPHRNTLHIRDFTVKGNTLELEKLNHLFACGSEGYASYRIPAIETSKKGTLLAFCEGRKHHHGDHGDIDIVLKRSTDHGKTWSPLQIVHDNNKHVAGNPVPIVDQKTGRIHLLSCTSSHHEYAIYKGNGRRGIFIQHSDDDGKTWSKPRDIAKNIYPSNWRWYATGPCSGIQIQQGKYAGRLVCPANHTIAKDGSDKNEFRAHSIYSDDQGKTWHLGSSSAAGGNESSIAEAGKDELFHSIRMQSHRQGMRGTRYSKDGGESWSTLKHDFNLPGPMCQGAVIRDYSKPSRLIHSNPGTGKGRTGMTIRISDDGGRSWPYSKLILNTSSAYSDCSITRDDQIALLYEGGHYDYAEEGIIFIRIDPESVKKSTPDAVKPTAKFGWGLWKERQEKFNTQARDGEIDLLLIGDSITHYWQKNKMCKTDGQIVWDKLFKSKKVANFGIGSDRTQHLLYRLQNGNLENISPKHVVLMIGTNNASSKHTPYEIYKGTEAIIKTIQNKCPDARILLYDIFPRIRGGQVAQARCQQANELTNSLCDGVRVIRCSINKQLNSADGKPRKEIFFDGIHISPEGYEIWAKDILKHTSKAL